MSSRLTSAGTRLPARHSVAPFLRVERGGEGAGLPIRNRLRYPSFADWIGRQRCGTRDLPHASGATPGHSFPSRQPSAGVEGGAGGRARRYRVRDQPAITAGRQLSQRLHATIRSVDEAAHAAVFDAFEGLADQVDLRALARLRPRLKAAPRRASPDNILVIRLSALGDFIQSLGCAAAIRRRHASGRITLLTTASFAELAAQLELFDAVLIDHRPKPFALAGWLALSRVLRQGRFDRVYDLQTFLAIRGLFVVVRLLEHARNVRASRGDARTHTPTSIATSSTRLKDRPSNC